MKLEIYNVLGQKIATLLDSHLDAGEHSAVWDSRDADGRTVATGVYFYSLRTGENVLTKKMVLMK